MDGCGSAFGGGGLLGANSTEGHEYFFVHHTSIIQQSTDYALDTSDARQIEVGAGIFVRGELLLGAINDVAVLVGRDLTFCWHGMAAI